MSDKWKPTEEMLKVAWAVFEHTAIGTPLPLAHALIAVQPLIEAEAREKLMDEIAREIRAINAIETQKATAD